MVHAGQHEQFNQDVRNRRAAERFKREKDEWTKRQKGNGRQPQQPRNSSPDGLHLQNVVERTIGRQCLWTSIAEAATHEGIQVTPDEVRRWAMFTMNEMQDYFGELWDIEESRAERATLPCNFTFADYIAGISMGYGDASLLEAEAASIHLGIDIRVYVRDQRQQPGMLRRKRPRCTISLCFDKAGRHWDWMKAAGSNVNYEQFGPLPDLAPGVYYRGGSSSSDTDSIHPALSGMPIANAWEAATCAFDQAKLVQKYQWCGTMKRCLDMDMPIRRESVEHEVQDDGDWMQYQVEGSSEEAK